MACKTLGLYLCVPWGLGPPLVILNHFMKGWSHLPWPLFLGTLLLAPQSFCPSTYSLPTPQKPL